MPSWGRIPAECNLMGCHIGDAIMDTSRVQPYWSATISDTKLGSDTSRVQPYWMPYWGCQAGVGYQQSATILDSILGMPEWIPAECNHVGVQPYRTSSWGRIPAKCNLIGCHIGCPCVCTRATTPLGDLSQEDQVNMHEGQELGFVNCDFNAGWRCRG